MAKLKEPIQVLHLLFIKLLYLFNRLKLANTLPKHVDPILGFRRLYTCTIMLQHLRKDALWIHP